MIRLMRALRVRIGRGAACCAPIPEHCHPDGGRFLADEGYAVVFPGEQQKLPPATHRAYEVTP
jgi:hypothetical protein